VKSPPRIHQIPSIEEVFTAYLNGYYPMAEGRHGHIGFYYYEPRGILPLDERFNIRKSLRQAIRKAGFEIRFDTAFAEVIQNCARHDVLSDAEVWISEELIPIYLELHRLGIAHSVETWKDNTLVGGLYGLAFGSAFCGESMFSLVSNASQAALIALVEHLRTHEFTLLDAQMVTEHLQQFGMISMPQKEYLEYFHSALENVDITF
jgi:leucyl/phenylalanyl-tRNA---protein transferase